MIAPRNTLLFWCGAVLLPLAILAAAAPALQILCLGGGVLFVWFVFLDAVAGRRRLGTMNAELPERVRCSKERPAELPLLLKFGKPFRGSLRLGMRFPDSFEAEEVKTIRIDDGEAQSYEVAWPFVPAKRGAYSFSRLDYEVASPLGFWAVRGHCPAVGEVRVYPNVLRDRRSLAALFLDRDAQGAHARRMRGKGREFDKLREYMAGDSYEDIHWKATARRGEPVTKTYQVEKTQEVYVIIDASRLGARSAKDPEGRIETQLERFLSAALVLGLVAERQGDLYGLATFSDKVHGFVRARRGNSHYNACRELLYQLEARPVSPDFEEVFSFLAQRLRRRALLIFLTNLDDPVLSESFVKNIEVLNRDHLVMTNMVTLPNVRPVFSAGSAENLDALYGQLAGHLQWQDLRETQRVLKRMGVSLGLADGGALCTELVAQYMRVKQAQLI